MPQSIHDEDDQYASAEDSDFAPEDAPDAASEASDSEGDSEAPATTKRKRETDDAADDAGFENSGDEAILSKGQKRRRKGKDRDADAARPDEGEDGPLVKTRSMRAAEYVPCLPESDRWSTNGTCVTERRSERLLSSAALLRLMSTHYGRR